VWPIHHVSLIANILVVVIIIAVIPPARDRSPLSLCAGKLRRKIIPNTPPLPHVCYAL
jgi:hypothetical protein